MLFTEIVIESLSTQGVKYAGSKLKLLPHILALAAKTGAGTVLDGFSGTTRVSQAFAKNGYGVICNDIAVWSETFGRCYLLNRKTRDEYAELFAHLNAAAPADGWFSEHYGGAAGDGRAAGSDGLKKPWQIHNTRKLDGIRDEIERLKLPPVDKAVVLTGLILALDRVDNSLGHHAAYLKNWSARSYGQLKLEIPDFCGGGRGHQVFRRDIFDLLPEVSADLAYFDPPYGSNNGKMPPSRVRYAAYYHLWTTVCLNDRPELFGKAKRRSDSSDVKSPSVFEEFRRGAAGRFIAVEAIERLIRGVNAQWVILSYSSGGRATARELDEVMRSCGRLAETVRLEYKRNVMSAMKWTNDWAASPGNPHEEFLFLLEKR